MSLEPAITDATARVSTWDASGIIDAMRNHILNDTTHLSIDAYTAGEGLTVGFLAAGEDQQVNFRKSAAGVIKVSIEPSGSITAPGSSPSTAPTGTSADWSGETASGVTVTTGSPASGSRFWAVEVADAFFFVITDPTNVFHTTILHCGRIATPLNSSTGPANGQDGLGFLCGTPDNGNGAGQDWIGATVPCSALHWSTNVWSAGVQWLVNPATSHVGSAADLVFRPLPPGTLQAMNVNGTSDPFYGTTKYIRCVPVLQTPRTVYTEPGVGDQGWLVYNDTSSTGNEAIIWRQSVTP